MATPEVLPIVCTVVDDFEEPPRRRRKDKQQNEIATGPRKQGGATSPKNEGVDGQNVTNPQRKKEIGRPEARQHPVQGPENGDQEHTQQAVCALKERYSEILLVSECRHLRANLSRIRA